MIVSLSLLMQALGFCVSCISEDYENVMKEPILPLLSRFLIDRVASTRRELSDLCTHILSSRIRARGVNLVREDLKLLSSLIMLVADDTEAVSSQSRTVFLFSLYVNVIYDLSHVSFPEFESTNGYMA